MHLAYKHGQGYNAAYFLKEYDYIGDPTLADAIMDRLVANASKIELKGDSMRQKLKK